MSFISLHNTWKKPNKFENIKAYQTYGKRAHNSKKGTSTVRTLTPLDFLFVNEIFIFQPSLSFPTNLWILTNFQDCRTRAIYHSTRDVLYKVYRVQTRFLEELYISEEEFLMEFSLAPLETRGGKTMLGLSYRTMIRKGPLHFKQHFSQDVSGWLIDPHDQIGGH